jgi:hypothetical protein
MRVLSSLTRLVQDQTSALIEAPPKSEHRIVTAAESATKVFADTDVTTASIKASAFFLNQITGL